VQRRWRLEAIENDADGALILTATYDHSLPVGETWASSRSKWTHLYPITNLNFDRVTNHGGCPPVARCRALKFYQASNPGAAHLIRNLRRAPYQSEFAENQSRPNRNRLALDRSRKNVEGLGAEP